MYTSIILIAAALSYVTATSAPTGPFFLGSPCSTSSQCPGGSQCYAVNSMLIARCGNFQASCTSDAQCATNSCVSGFCSGPVAPTLPLGTPCYESAQCANGASCYAVNSMLIPRCGNSQATCTSDSQCAFNTCVNGFCSGMVSSNSSSSTSTLTSTSSSSTPAYSSNVTIVSTTAPILNATSTTMTMMTAPASGTGSVIIVATGNSTIPSATRIPPPVFTGGASEKLCTSLRSAMVASAVTFALMILI